jgi:hypothetical protein
MRAVLACVAVTLLLPASSVDVRVGTLRVLFVGNSLTEANDLPARVATLAAASGRKLEYRTIAFGGYSLEDHWAQGDARAALATRSWDIVVMQQGPSALPEGQLHLRTWATRWADEARAAGTRPALLTVWPESFRRSANRLRDLVVQARGAGGAHQAPPRGQGVGVGVELRRAHPALRPGRVSPDPAGDAGCGVRRLRAALPGGSRHRQDTPGADSPEGRGQGPRTSHASPLRVAILPRWPNRPPRGSTTTSPLAS